MISRRMFAKAKSTLNSSENLRSRDAFGDTLYRQVYSRSYKGHLKYTIPIASLHVLRIFIYRRQITLLGNKVTGVGTKVFEARPRQSSRYSAFSKTYPPVCASYLRLLLLLFSLIIPLPSIDLTEGSPEFSRGSPAVEATHSRILDRSNILEPQLRFASLRFASHRVALHRDALPSERTERRENYWG